MTSSLQSGQDIIVKFNVKNKVLYTKVLWKEDDKDLFHIKVFNEDSTWTGKYSNELASIRRQRLDETEEEYKKNVKICLCSHCKDHIYEFIINDNDVNSASFTWKKQYDGALITQGAVPLQRDEVPTSKDILLDSLIQKNTDLISEVELAKEKNCRLKQDLQQYIQRLEELTENKLLLESTLYGRFVQVLNEKKRRIQLQQEHFNTANASE